ncbi:nucleotide exchange factor GrpE [Paenibacillus sp. YN15]|uniref:nucleotide exchange factor GrpE n=1 Tax=Paenibacillus sp. YN15 TaxID=1742774 RepID=UPI0037C9FCAD
MNEQTAEETATYTEAEGIKAEEAAPEAPETENGGGEAAAELEALRKQAEENQERYLRTQADFDNFRRRSRQEKEDFAKYASSKLVEQLLPVLDNFERAMAASKDSRDFDSLLKGLDMIQRQLGQTLEQEGLKAMNAEGEPFNPEFHQAVMQVESDEHGEGIVVEEMQKGYMFKDKVLRPAMVKVSK